jgi:multidrug efflux pump subunit AcrB
MLTDLGGSAVIARAIAAVTLTALTLSLTLLPPLLLWDMGEEGIPVQGTIPLPYPLRYAARYAHRFLAADIRFCMRKNKQILAAGFLFSALGAGALFMRGADAGKPASEYSVYARIEFEGGFLAEEGDRLLAAFSEALAGKTGIRNVQTEAGTSGGSALILFDPVRTNADKVRELARSLDIAGGFLFFPETTQGERHWEIKIFGDDDKKCRELAEEMALLCTGLPAVREGILNFKEGSRRIILTPDREGLAETGISFSAAADSVRRRVHGPVAYKRIGRGGEIDVRVRTTDAERGKGAEPGRPDTRTTGGEIPGILVPVINHDADASEAGRKNRALRIESLMKSREDREPSSIRREDRRRTASITIVTGNRDPRRVKKDLGPAFENLKLPPGYTVEFDPEAIRRAGTLGKIYLSFLLALVFCYMVIASINESFTVPLAVLSTVPPSLALPALCIAISGQPVNSAAACAFVAVSGMAVNAAVLCAAALTAGGASPAGSRRNAGCSPAMTDLGLYRALRRKMPSLLATGLTTVAGALPFLLLREEVNALVRTLSLVTALGVGGSCFCSLCILPAFFLFMKKISNGGGFFKMSNSEKGSAYIQRKKFRLSGRG